MAEMEAATFAYIKNKVTSYIKFDNKEIHNMTNLIFNLTSGIHGMNYLVKLVNVYEHSKNEDIPLTSIRRAATLAITSVDPMLKHFYQVFHEVAKDSSKGHVPLKQLYKLYDMFKLYSIYQGLISTETQVLREVLEQQGLGTSKGRGWATFSGSDNPTGNDITKLDKDGKPVSPPTKAPEMGVDGKLDPKYNGRVDNNIKIPEQATGASIWQEIVLTVKKSTKDASDVLTASVAHSDWQLGLFFASASGASDKSASNSNIKHSSKDTDIQIGMRVMKVSIDRPWMNTQLLSQSQEFFHYNATPFSDGAPSDVKSALAKPKDVTAQKFLDNASNKLIPSWTTVFIIAKDVHIVMTSDTEFDSAEISDMKSIVNSGGGILCFSCSKSKSSSDHSSKTSFTSSSKTISIKIPAPQVIGWNSHLAPKDQCKPYYSSLPADQLKVKGTQGDRRVQKPLEAEKAPIDGFAARGAVRANGVAVPKPIIQTSNTRVVSTPAPEKGFVDGFAARGGLAMTPPKTPPVIAS